LVQGPFWTGASPDGRSSAAMADLVLRAHAFQEAGWPVSLLAFGVDAAPPAAPSTPAGGAAGGAAGGPMGLPQRGRAGAHVRGGGGGVGGGTTVVALTGNLPGRRTLGLPWDPTFVPMGSVLADRGPLVSILVKAQNGSAWNCQSDGCKAWTFGSPDAPAVPPAV